MVSAIAEGISNPRNSMVDAHLATGTVVRFDTSLGTFDVEMLDAQAPMHVTAFMDDLDRLDSMPSGPVPKIARR